MLDVLLGSGLSAPLLPSHLLVSAPRVLLHASGDLSLQGGRLSPPPATVALARPADHLMTAEDWRQLALHSAVVTLAACVPATAVRERGKSGLDWSGRKSNERQGGPRLAW